MRASLRVSPVSIPFVSGEYPGYNMLSRLAVTRALDTATYFDGLGALQTALANTPRFDHDPVTRAFRGLLVEPTAVNLIQRSNEFDNTAWTKSTLTVTPTSGLFTLTATGVNSVLQRAETVTSGVALAGSIFVRRKTGSSNINMRVGDLSPTFVITPDITLRRYERTATPTSTTGRLALSIAASADELEAQYAQLEVGSVSTSYIPNTGAVQNTRNADRCEITGANFSAIWGGTEKTIYVEFEARETTPAAARHVLDISDGTTNNRIQAYVAATTGNVVFQVSTASSLVVSQTLGAIVAGRNKLALRIKENDCTGALNGVVATADTSCTIPTVDRAMLGADLSFTASTILNGWIKTARVIPRAYSDAELDSLTS